ncbi:M12 family metallopeptidase [Spirobacillus cienkowskii]|uniref:M12 family metallopeptidase n=1 Tax=Spirobacillus cienkowskii TaxID=495820 RepID=UPI0030CAB59F
MNFFLKNCVLYSSSLFVTLFSYANENSFNFLNVEELRQESAPMPEVSYFPEHNGVIHYRAKYWPEGKVFYRFAENHYTEEQKEIILSAMRKIEQVAKIKFIEQTDKEKYYVIIERYNSTTGEDYGCSSDIGLQDYFVKFKKDFKQVLALGRNCLYKKLYQGYNLVELPDNSTVLHELMHTLGIHHEQSRQDRDDHIVLLPENSSSSKIEENINYTKNHEQFTSSITSYDFNSIMQYHPYSGSKDGYPVMIPKKCELLYRQNPEIFHIRNVFSIVGCDEIKQMINRSEELTRLDICTLQAMYGEPQEVPNPVDCSDLFSRVSGNKKVTKDEVNNANGEKLLIKISSKQENNEKHKIAPKLFMSGDQIDIINCKTKKEFSSDWKTFQESNMLLSYYIYFSEKDGTCKQEIHTYEYDQVEKKWPENPNIIKIIID